MNVARWLSDLGLDQYIQTFEANDIDAQTLRELTDADLIDIGVKSLGHRRKLRSAIAALKATANDETVAEAVAHPRDAAHHLVERRQISVMYCHLVGSTALSHRLDAEDYRELVQRFNQACLQRVAEYDGWVANFVGDFVLAYFGWPRAHEDDAERTVRAGLAIMRAIQDSDVLGERLAVRVGIASGSVVVGDLIREGPAWEQSAVGVTPNLGARLQALAEPGQMVIDDLTRRLLGAGFAVQPLGEHRLKGIAEPVTAYAVLGEHATDSRFDARARVLAPMVGRDQELALLRERWTQAQAGEGQAVLLVGEAGIGKSRLVRALLDASTPQPHWRVRWQCSPYHTGSALWPVIQRLSRTAGLQDEDSAEAALDKLEAAIGRNEETAALFATLLGLNGAQRYGPVQMTPQMLRERTLEVLAEQLLELAEQRPLLLVVEDAHWIDPTTLELIERCLERADTARLLLLMTTRPDQQPALGAHPSVTRMSLNRLARANVQAIVQGLAGEQLQPHILATIVERTDGVPLFVEELTKAVLETGEAAIPASLHGSLMARLDHVPEVKEVAQMAACIGREFDVALLEAVTERPEIIEAALDKLAAAEIIFRRRGPSGTSYTFKHALVQEAAYESMLHSRREAIHARLLQVLEEARRSTSPEILAHHALQAELVDKAIGYWGDAGHAALAKSAYIEAAGHLRRAIELVRSRRDGVDRSDQELTLQLRLGQAYCPTMGYGAEPATRAFSRAHELLLRAEPDHPHRLAVYYGQWSGGLFRYDMNKALDVALTALAAEKSVGSPGSLLFARRMVATSRAILGDFKQAELEFEQAMSLEGAEGVDALTAELGLDPVLGLLYQYAWTLCIEGHVDRSQQLMERARSRCTDRTPLLQRAHLLFMFALRAALLRDFVTASNETLALAALTSQHRMLPRYEDYVDILRGWAAAESGHPSDQDIAAHARAVSSLETHASRHYMPIFKGTLALGLSACGRHDDAQHTIAAALAECERSAEGWCDAELWRIRGQLSLRAPQRDALSAAHCFEQALALARTRGAKLWELRAAVSLARLRIEQGASSEAVDVLMPVHAAFTEGFASVDYLEARRLLTKLGGPRLGGESRTPAIEPL